MRRDCTAITRVRAAAARFALIRPLRGQLPPMGKPNKKAPLAERFPVLTYSLSYNTAGTAGAKGPWASLKTRRKCAVVIKPVFSAMSEMLSFDFSMRFCAALMRTPLIYSMSERLMDFLKRRLR